MRANRVRCPDHCRRLLALLRQASDLLEAPDIIVRCGTGPPASAIAPTPGAADGPAPLGPGQMWLGCGQGDRAAISAVRIAAAACTSDGVHRCARRGAAPTYARSHLRPLPLRHNPTYAQSHLYGRSHLAHSHHTHSPRGSSASLSGAVRCCRVLTPAAVAAACDR